MPRWFAALLLAMAAVWTFAVLVVPLELIAFPHGLTVGVPRSMIWAYVAGVMAANILAVAGLYWTARIFGRAF